MDNSNDKSGAGQLMGDQMGQPAQAGTPAGNAMQQPMIGQSTNQPIIGQPMMGQPMMGQPMMQRKPPMDPEKKKKLTMIIIIASAAVVLGMALIIILPIVFRADYGESYRTAQDVKPGMNSFSNSSACENVVKYADSTSTDMKTYNGYIDSCRDWGDGLMEELERLGATSGVKRDSALKEQYNKVHDSLEAVLPNSEEMESKLNIYQVWHQFRTASTSAGTDAVHETKANILKNSGIEAFQKFGAEWLEQSYAYLRAHRAYDNASYSDPNISALREARNQATTTFNTWWSENLPDVSTVAGGGIKVQNVSKVTSEWSKLYKMIAKRYEENYEFGTDDCTEFLNTVTCN